MNRRTFLASCAAAAVPLPPIPISRTVVQEAWPTAYIYSPGLASELVSITRRAYVPDLIARVWDNSPLWEQFAHA